MPGTYSIQRLKKFIRSIQRAARRRYVALFHSFNSADFSAALAGLGIGPGDVLMVHSAFDAFEGFDGKPTDILQTLESLVSPAGTVLMPSIPFAGTAIEYVQSGKITNLRRTPSRMGILSELFRRQEGTLRSIHPTHPVLGRGGRAAAMLADHARAGTPCGVHSPFAKLLEADGKIVLLGTGIEAMTFFHYLEEAYEDRLQPSPLSDEVFEVGVRDGGETYMVSTRLFKPAISRHRSVARILPALRLEDGFCRGHVGVLELMVIPAASARNAFVRSLDNGVCFYDR